MFSKRLRFSISIFLVILFFNQITHLSFAQVLKSNNTVGWTRHDLTTYPPKINDESYLYYSGTTSDLKGLKIEVKSIPTVTKETEELIQASATFEYWGYGGQPVTDTDGYSATDLFSLGVSFRSEAKPDTIWAPFNQSTLGNLRGDEWGYFHTDYENPVYPARIMITPNLASTASDIPYYVALKGIEIVYTFKNTENVSVVTTNSTTNETITSSYTNVTERTVVLKCSSTSCIDFVITNQAGLMWSDMFFPTKPQNFNEFLTPNTGSSSPYQLTLTKSEGTDICVPINYWLTEGVNLTVNIDSSSSPLVLYPTYSVQSSSIDLSDSKYDWYKIEICLSHFIYNASTGDHTLSLTAGTVTSPDYIAIGEIDSSNITTPALIESTKMILQSWSKSAIRPTDEWHYLPMNLGSVSADNSSLLLSSVANGHGTIHLYSDWFDFTTGLELRQKMRITSCPPQLDVTLQLIDAGNNLISSQSSDICSTSSQTTSEKIYSLTQGVLGSPHRLQFVIHWVQGANPTTLSISEVDLSDACRLDRLECSDHGICQVTSPNVAVCECDNGYMREKCQKPDYCVLKFEETESVGTMVNISGTEYCTERSGTCNSETFDPELRKICDCGATRYWKYNETSGHACADLDPCTGIDVFCPIGYKCASDQNVTDCTACDTANGYALNSEGKCVKSNPCDASTSPCMQGSNCTVYENNAVCYCTNGEEYSTATGCDTNKCPLDMRNQLNCQHSCETESGEAKCTCLPGYKLIENTTDCEMDFVCSENCSNTTGSICLFDGATNKSYCDCLPGYVLTGTTCVDICTAAATNVTEAVNQVKSLCGSSICSMNDTKLTCTCGAPYLTGSDGRCHIETTCLPGGRGYADCSSKGAICQPKLQASESGGNLWECVCPIGTTQLSNKTCVEQCSINEKSCLFDNAVCQKSLTLGATSHECVCQPGLKKNETDGRCYLIERSLRVEMITRLDESVTTSLDATLQHRVKSFYMAAPTINDVCPYYSPLDIPGCIDYLTKSAQDKYEMQKPSLMERAIRKELISTLKSDLANVYGNTFGDINILAYSKLLTNSTSLGGDYNVILSLELTDPETETEIPLDDQAVCHSFPASIQGASSYCFIPTHSVLQRSSIHQTDLAPCNETLIDYCPSNTNCKPLDYSRFSCDCDEGFKAETIIQMDALARSSYYKEYCEDIDECSATVNPCRQHSTCINTIGGFFCPCNHEFVEDPTTGTCINVCSTVTCVYGECFVIANNTGTCRCHEGYRGETCEEQDPMVTTFRTALITVAVVLGILLILVVLVAVILIKKTKRSAMKQNAERPLAEYGKPQVPKRYQDNSGFTND